MDHSTLLDFWEHLRFVWAGIVLVLALASGFVIWRVRGLLNWKRSQRQALTELQQWRDHSNGAKALALDEIIATCHSIWRSTSPDLGQLAQLPTYWRRIAAHYHPDEPEPELCLSIGQLLTAAQQLSQGLSVLLERPGFDRLGGVRIRQLRRTYDWYQRLNAHPGFAWIMARRRALSKFWHTLRFVWPDPLAWMAYLSQRLTMMMAVRCLLMDVYLFTGKVALEAFDTQGNSTSIPEGVDTAVEVLDAYESIINEDARPAPPELEALRSELVGLPARLWRPPEITEWRDAVIKAATLIAADYFPESATPLEEARCHVLLNRSRYWLEAMAGARRLPVVRPLYQVSLKRLMQIKTMSESEFWRRSGKVASRAWTAWRWTRWPFKVFRWVRRRSPAGIAVEVGFTLAGKAAFNYLARYGFDLACRDLDHVYRLSSNPERSRPPDEKKSDRAPSTLNDL